jgi:hypothetical protein
MCTSENQLQIIDKKCYEIISQVSLSDNITHRQFERKNLLQDKYLILGVMKSIYL